MGDYQNINWNVEGRTGIITIDHPPANALDRQTVEELSAAFDEAIENEQVKVIILTGAGQFFGAGADINEIVELKSYEQAYEIVRLGQRLFSRIEQAPKPVIAAINGRFCLGGLNELAMACHIRLAEDSVQFGQPEIKLGIMTGAGGSQRLPRLVGTGKAMEMILTGDPIGSDEALRYGLVTQVVPDDQLEEAVNAIVGKLLKKSATALQLSKEAVIAANTKGLYDGVAHELKLFSGIFETADAKEGVQAFLEKRKPEFNK